MKQFAFYALAFAFLILGTWIYSNSGKPVTESVSEASNTVQLGEIEEVPIVLSSTFAKQLSSFSFEFGDFSTASDFLGLVAGDTVQVDLLKERESFCVVLEIPLPSELTYAEFVSQIQNALGDIELKPAAFGPDSFYFLRDGFTTNILPLGESVLAFQFDPANFEEIRRLISSLIIFY